MSQTGRLIDTLKKCLRARGVTYRDVAGALNLSEASIKRVFSEKTLSLQRLEEICALLDLTIYDLAKLGMDTQDGPGELTLEQERGLSENPGLLVFFYLLVSGRNPDSIIADYRISREESLQFLFALDRLKLIELHPENRVRVLAPRNIAWRKNGPIEKTYKKQIKDELLNGSFDRPGEHLRFETGKLSDDSRSVMLKKIDRLFKEYHEFTALDKTLPPDQIENTGLIVAFRPWVFSLIDAFKR
ncbi:MAG: helix-turn-helix transcriptional regulator [Desulfosalsimonadaceae bacterium]